MNLFIIRYAAVLAQAIVVCSLLLPVLLHFIFYLKKGLQKQQPVSEELFEEKDYAVVVCGITSSQQADAVLRSVLELNYTNYLVYVVTNESCLHPFYANHEKIIWLQPDVPLTDDFNLHQYTIGSLKRSHTHIVFLDESSIVDPGYLTGLNVCFHQGFQAAQSMSIIKNKQSIVNAIYNLRNSYNCFFRCHLLFNLGSSATINRTGMAFSIPFYKQLLQHAKPMAAGIVNTMQNAILKSGYQIAFAATAVLVNESQFNFQQLKMLHMHGINAWRKQWLGNCKLLCKGIVWFNKNCFLSGIMLLQLPLFITLLAAVVCLFMAVWTNPFAAFIWMISLVLFSFGFLFAMREINPNTSSSSEPQSILPSIKNLYEEREAEMYSAV